ncbi:MAG: GspE/PulE family protein [Gammaproteobacteria bacterium]|nr:GspE/PulE family protein [Gammaproteobacteria bacterium]
MATSTKKGSNWQQQASQPDKKLELNQIIHLLATDKLLSKESSDQLFRSPQSSNKVEMHPLVIIANEKVTSAKPPHNVLDIETLSQWFADKIGLPYFHIDPLKIDVAAAASVMKYSYAERNKILPVEVAKDYITVATAEPYVREWEPEIAHITKKQIRRVFTNPADINRYVVEFYSLARSVSHAMEETGGNDLGSISNLEQLVELSRAGKLDANDQHVVTIVDWLLQYAFEQRASDIHIEPRRDQGRIRFRIDGTLHLVYQLPPAVTAAVSSRLKILGRMDVAEKRRPQDGRVKTKTPDGKEIELRLSTMPTAFGEKLVMRIFDPEVLVKSFKELGLSDEDYKRWQHMVTQPNGIVLVTGPTGSGKTTTLYTTLKQLAQPEVNVCTIEDPIEMIEESFNQMQVQHNIELDFAAGVRNLLRQDPDIIMVGEIRDQETADMATQASLTGHLVLSTLHTNDSVSAITRLLDIGIPPYLINATLLGIVAQRLVRCLCPHCKQPGHLDDQQWQALVSPWKINKPETVYAPKGCLECRNTGYLGRMGIYEVLTMSQQTKKLVTTDCDTNKLRRQAMKEGMRTLRISGAQKIIAGLTTIEEVFKVAPAYED